MNCQKWLSKNGFKMGHLNACHLLNKLSEVPQLLSDSGNCFHVFGYSESRFSQVIDDSIITIPGYNIIRKDATCKLETGLVAYIHQSVNYKHLTRFDKHNIECIWLEVSLKKSKPIVIGLLYRNPEERCDWFNRFELMIEDVLNYSNEVVLLGDFNIDLLKPNNTWKRIIESYNLTIADHHLPMQGSMPNN